MRHSRSRVFAVLALLASSMLVTFLMGGFAGDAGARSVLVADTKFSTGICTIGDGNTTSGTFNTSLFEGNPASTLRRAVEFSNTVRFLKGTYTFTEPFISGRSNIEITADPGTIFVCSGTNSPAFLDLSGDDVTVSGITFQWDTWVDDQIGVRFKGPSLASKRAKVRDCKFVVTPSTEFYNDHDDAHPMVFLDMNLVFTKWVERNWWFPQVGVLCYRSSEGAGLNFVNNEISNGVDQGFPDLSVFADMYGGLLLDGEEWCRVQNNKMWAIGNYTLGLEPAFGIRFDGSTTSNDEYGHFLCTGNIIENVNTPAPIDLISCQWFNISGNLVGPNFAAVNADGEAAIKVRGSNGTSVTLTTIVTGTKTFTFTQNPNLSTGETFYVLTTGLANPANARTYTAASASTGSGPYTVVTSETPSAAETAITGAAIVATSGSVGPKKSWAGLIASNDLHNLVGQESAGTGIWLEHCEKIAVNANSINLNRGKSIVKVATASCQDVTFGGNAFSFYENAGINPTAVFIFTDGIANRVGMTGNTYVGDPTFVSGTVTGSFWFPYGLQEHTVDGGDTTLTPEAADTAEQLTTNLNLNNG